jgi:hypothetical protein
LVIASRQETLKNGVRVIKRMPLDSLLGFILLPDETGFPRGYGESGR